MALQKTIQTSYQVPAEYWKIVDLPATFKIVGYVNREARLAGANALGEFEYLISEDTLNQIKTLLYNEVKTKEEFLEATNI